MALNYYFQPQGTEHPVIFRASESANYRYELSIKTGVWSGSGTTANTSFTIYGSEGNSGTLTIKQDLSAGFKPIFARGTEHTFAAILDKDLGDICALYVCHDNSGNDPSWFLEDITIVTPHTEKSCTFSFDMWLSLEDDSLSNETTQSPSKSPRSITATALREMFSDGHLWLSVVTKTPGSCFSRVQRVTSCLCLLSCTMAANAAFYYWGGQSFQPISLGPFQFSARQAITSIQTNLLTLPVHIVTLLFKKTSARLQNRFWRWLLYLTWLLCCIMIATSAGVTISYSLMWGSEKSQEWISSVAVSFFQDVLIVQPCKCFVLSVLWLMLSNCKPNRLFPRQQPVEEMANEKARPLSTKESQLSRSRKDSVSMARRRLMIRQAFFYLAFLVVVGVLTYGNRDSSRYLLSKSLKDHTRPFEKVRKQIDNFIIHSTFKKWLCVCVTCMIIADQWIIIGIEGG